MENVDKIRKKIREEISNIEESDLIYKSKDNWNDAKKQIKTDVSNLLSNLDNDDYQEGVDLIDKVVDSLKKWKSKIKKTLDN